MARIKLTKSAVDAAKPQAQAVELRDTVVPGFMCKITPAGRKVFMLQYRTNAGERRKPALGQYGELTVEQARVMAQEWLAEVRRGGDPSAAKAAARKAQTMKEYCLTFMEDYSRQRNKPSTQRGYPRAERHGRGTVRRSVGRYAGRGQALEGARLRGVRAGGRPSGRHLPRRLHGTGRRCGACATCVSEEVQVRHRHTAAGRGVDREAVKGSARPIWCEREIVMTRKDHPQGTDNVLADLGFADAEELSAKAVLAVKLNELIDKRSLSQTEAAHITGMTQPKVSQVRRYKLQNISLERLMQALVSLDQHVEIVVRPARRAHAAGITVAA